MPVEQFDLDKIRQWKDAFASQIKKLKPRRINKYKNDISRGFRRRFTERELWHVVSLRFGDRWDIERPVKSWREMREATGVAESTLRSICARFIRDGGRIILNRKFNECAPHRVKITAEIGQYLTQPSTL